MKPMIRLLSLSALVLSALFAALFFARPSNQLSITFPQAGVGTPFSQEDKESVGLAAPVLVASAGSDRITIDWAPIVSAATYEIWGRQGEAAWERLDDGSLTHNVTSHTHSGLASGDTYSYTGRAAPVAGAKSAWAAEVEATVSYVPSLTANATAGRIELGWTSVAGAGSYQLIVWTDGLNDWERIGDPITGTITITSYTHTGLTELNTYHYRVRAVIDDTEGDWSDSVSEIPVRPAAPDLSRHRRYRSDRAELDRRLRRRKLPAYQLDRRPDRLATHRRSPHRRYNLLLPHRSHRRKDLLLSGQCSDPRH